jgi:hypothetical protein
VRHPSQIPLRRATLLLAGLIAAACSSGGDGGTGPGPTPTIALFLASSSASVAQGGSAQVSATLTRGGGFTGTVALTVEGAPTGVTGAVSNVTTSGGTTTALVTVTVAAATAPGLYTLTVRGTGAGVSAATASFALTVTAAPDYSLSLSPASASLVQGASSAPIAVTISRTNFTSGVTLSLAPGSSAVPVGVTAAFTPPAPESPTASLVVTVAAATAPGTYNLTVSGTGAPGARSTPFTLTVTAAGSFSLGLTPAGGVTLQQGASDNSKTVTITRTSYAANVTLTAENLPTGVTAAFAGNPVGGNNSVMTLTATAGAPVVGPVTVTIRGSGPAALVGPGGKANLEATVTFQLTVVPQGSFTLGMPASCAQNFQLRQGALDDRRIVTMARTNFPMPIQFSVEGLPSGLTAGFDVNPVSGDAIRLRFTADPALSAGDYPITVRGTGPGGVTATLPMVINIHAVTEPFDPNLLVYDFTAASADGWRRGVLCPFPTGGAGHVDWGVGIFQEDMLVLDGRGPASNRQEANAWITRTIALPAGATVFRFNASAHPLNDSRTRVRVRVVDGATSTVVFNQVLTGSAPARTFQTYDANIAPWAGKTVRIFVEQLDDLASHGQLWLDTIRIF